MARKFLKYITSSVANSYIDTGIMPNGHTKLEMDLFRVTKVGGDYWGTQNPWFGLRIWSGKWQPVYSPIGWQYRNVSLAANTDYTLSMDWSKIVANDTEFYIDPAVTAPVEFQSTKSFFVGKINGGQQSANDGTSYGRIKFYTDTTLVGDFIPCEQDGVVGLYSVLEDRFIAPSAGSFIAGPDLAEASIDKNVFTFVGGDATISIETSSDWTVSAPDFVTLSQVSGTGDAEVIATIPENTGSKRNFSIVVNAGGVDFIFPITQKQEGIKSNSLAFNGKNINKCFINGKMVVRNVGNKPYAYSDDIDVPGDGMDSDIDIFSNTYWTASTEADWIELSNNTGYGDGTFHINVASTEEDRETTINLTSKSGLFVSEFSITVKQREGYKQVIPHFTGKQYFNLNGINGSSQIRSEIIFKYDGNVSSSGWFLAGARDGSAAFAYAPTVFPDSLRFASDSTWQTTGALSLSSNNWYKGETWVRGDATLSYQKVGVKISSLNENEDIISGNYTTLKEVDTRTGTTAWFSTSKYNLSSDYDFMLGRCRSGEAPDTGRIYNGKIASFKIWRNLTAIANNNINAQDIPNDLVRDIIFLLKDGKVWAYDKLNKVWIEQVVEDGGTPLEYEEYGTYIE